MRLKQLLKGLSCTLVQGDLNAEVKDIYYDSRKIAPGGLFVCIVGTQRDSHDLAADAAAKGAGVLAIQHPLDDAVLAPTASTTPATTMTSTIRPPKATICSGFCASWSMPAVTPA